MQEPGTAEERIPISHFDGVNGTVQPKLARIEELLHAENIRSPIIGVIEKREGQTVHGTISGSVTANNGIFKFSNTNGSYTDKYRISTISGNNRIFVLNTSGVWTALASAAAQNLPSGVFDYANVEGTKVLVNQAGENRMLDEDGDTVVASNNPGSLFNSPNANRVAFYKNRIYLADIERSGTRYRTTIQRSSYPLGIIALVNGDYAPENPGDNWEIPLTDTKYFYSTAGMNVYDVYRGAEKIATLSVAAVQETSITVTDSNMVFEPGISNLLSSDEVWIGGTFEGEKIFRWANNSAATGRDVKQYDTFKLTGGDEDEITMMVPIGDVLMMANRNNMMSWNDYTLYNYDFGVGCTSKRGYVKIMGTLYFMHYSGVYGTNGEMPRLLSRKVARYISGATRSGIENCAAGAAGLSVFFAIGDSTLYNPDGSQFKVLPDVCLEYNLADENWYVHTNVPAAEFETFLSDAGKDQILFTHKNTFQVRQFLDGADDAGAEIFMRADTQPIQLMQEFETYGTLISIVTEVERGSTTKCYVSQDGGAFFPLEGDVRKGVTTIKIPSPDKQGGRPIIARKIQLSYRDASRQRPRINQLAITYIPTTVDHAE